MRPITYPIQLYQGTAWRLESVFRDEDGVPMDLSIYAAELMIRRFITDSEPLLTLSTENSGITLSNNPAANLIIRISRTQTLSLPTHNREIEDWVYDMKIWNASDPEYTTVRLLEGLVLVSPAVTRPPST